MKTKKKGPARAHHATLPDGILATLLIGLIVLLVLGASWYLWYFYTL